MNLNKRLILYNGATLAIPLLITILIGTLLFILSPYIFGRETNYDSIKKLSEVNYELMGANSEQLVREPELLLDKAYQEYLAAKFNAVGANVVIFKNMKVMFSSKKLSKIELQKCQEATEENILSSVVKLDDSSYFVKAVNFKFSDGEDGKLFMLSSIEGDGLAATKIIIISAVLFILCYLITNVYYGYIITKRVTRPLKRLQEAAKNISNGKLDEEIYEQGEEEIRILSKSFEEMRLKLRESIEIQIKYDKNRTMLLSSISHDLRTPITAIKGYIEGVLDGVADTEAKREKYLRTVYQKASLMDEMIDDILLYSKLDLNQLPYDFRKTNVYEYLTDVVSDYEGILIKSNISISLINEIPEKRYIMLDANRIIRVFNNIIDNSKKYMNNSAGSIEIKLRETKASVIIEIKDNGKGIDEVVLPNIFDRFYRADAARSNVSGSGLGLAICRQIIEGHGGRIWAKSKFGEGTSIMISLTKV